MTTLVFANNASSSLAGAISNTATTCLLQAGGGALFPNPSAGQYFVFTLTDAATGLLREICWCMARSTDTLTIVRGQEGTTPLSWLAGDFVNSLWTAGQAAQMLQISAAPSSQVFSGVDTGTANTYVVSTTSPAIPSLIRGIILVVQISNASTGASTLNVAAGGPIAIKRYGGTAAIQANDLPAGGMATFIYDGTFWQLSEVNVSSFVVSGQARLLFTSSTVVTLKPYNGQLLTIAGVNYQIPSAGVPATITSCFVNGTAAQTLSAGTLYYVYVFNNSGTLALDFSTTTHATDATAGNVGIEIKTGDNSRSLVGMVYPLTGPVFASSAGNQLVVSWFNRRGLSATNAFTTNRSTSSTSYVEINAEIRCQFLDWGVESVLVSLNGALQNSSGANVVASTSCAFNGASPEDCFNQSILNSSGGLNIQPVGISFSKTGLTEGFNYATLVGMVGSGTCAWQGGSSAGSRTTVNVDIRG